MSKNSLHPDMRFDSFTPSTDAQRGALTLMKEAAGRFCTTRGRPGLAIFVSGKAGTGKTHLAQAFLHEVLEDRSWGTMGGPTWSYYDGWRNDLKVGLSLGSFDCKPGMCVIDGLWMRFPADQVPAEAIAALEDVVVRAFDLGVTLIVTTHHPFELVRQKLCQGDHSGALASRLARWNPLTLDGADYRTKMV